MRALAAVVALLCVAGCEKDRKPVPRPASVIVDITRANSHSVDGYKAYIAAVNPLMAVGMDDASIVGSLAPSLGLTKLDAIDREAPLHVLVVDHGEGNELVLLAKVASTKALDEAKTQHAAIETRDGWAMIGRDATAVHEVAPYGFSTLAAAPAPAQPTVTVYLSRFAALHESGFAAVRDRMLEVQRMSGPVRDFMRAYFDGAFAAARDTEELRATIDANADRAELAIVMTPRRDSDLAKFVALQKPYDFALLAKLPAEPAMFTLSSKLVGGPYHEAFTKLLTGIYGKADMSGLLAALSGELTLTASLDAGGMRMIQLIGVDSPAAATTALSSIQQALASGQTIATGEISTTFRSLPGTVDHDGTALYRFEQDVDVSAAPQISQRVVDRMAPGGKQLAGVAVVGNVIVNALGVDGETLAGHVIDVVRGKLPGLVAPPAAAALLDAARARKDSAALLLDLASIRAMVGGGTYAPAPVALTFGKSGDQASIHVTVPAASVRAVM